MQIALTGLFMVVCVVLLAFVFLVTLLAPLTFVLASALWILNYV